MRCLFSGSFTITSGRACRDVLDLRKLFCTKYSSSLRSPEDSRIFSRIISPRSPCALAEVVSARVSLPVSAESCWFNPISSRTCSASAERSLPSCTYTSSTFCWKLLIFSDSGVSNCERFV